MCTFSLKKVPRLEKVCLQTARARRWGALGISLRTPRLKRLRQCLPSYLAGAPASVGALPSKDRKNVQSAGLISGRSTEPAARAAKAFDRDIMALLLHRAINRDIAAGKFKKASAAPNFISKEVT